LTNNVDDLLLNTETVSGENLDNSLNGNFDPLSGQADFDPLSRQADSNTINWKII
jgi:hypothetical protein